MKKILDKLPIIIRSFVTILLFYCSVVFQYIPVLLFHISRKTLSGNYRMASLLATFSSLIILGIILVVYKRDLAEEFHIFRLKWKRNILTGGACWLAGLFFMIFANTILIFVFHSEGANNDLVVRSMIAAYPAVMGLDVCILAPIIEEIVYRKSLKDVFDNQYVFIIASFLFFGLAHVATMATSFVDWLYVIPYGTFGAAFAYAYSKTDTVFTSILFHMVHNIFTFILILLLSTL